MKSVLCVCNTYYQLLMVIQLKLTILKNKKVTLYISDHSRNSKSIVDNLKKINIFYKVEYIKTWELDHKNRNIFQHLYSVWEIFRGNIDYINSKIGKEVYDEIFFYNYDIAICSIFGVLIKKNKNLKCYRFEEGLLGYGLSICNKDMELSGRLKILYLLKKIFGQPILKEKIEYYYCLYPNLYKGSLKPKCISFFDLKNKNFVLLLKKIFKIPTLDYKEKYIFFTSVCDFEGGKPIEELKIIRKISSIVGKENLLIKMHPRDRRDIFKKEGFHIDKRNDIPWEVICLSYNFKDHIFLTTVSGCVLFSSLMKENSPKILFLYKLCYLEENYTAKNALKYLNDYLNNDLSRKNFYNVSIISNLEEIKKYNKGDFV